jgi:hypothetical protein
VSAAQIIDELPKLTADELQAVRRKLAEIVAENSSTALANDGIDATPPHTKKTREQVRHAIEHSKMQFDMTWDELRELTREP